MGGARASAVDHDQARWKAFDDDEQRCEVRAATLRRRGLALLETDRQPPANPESMPAGRRLTGLKVRPLSEMELAVVFAWLGEDDIEYWDAAGAAFVSIFDDEVARGGRGGSILRGIFARWSKQPLGLVVSQEGGLGIDFLVVARGSRRLGLGAAAVRLVEAAMAAAGRAVHKIDALPEVVDFWRGLSAPSRGG
jgi:hypothetical protein